MTHLATKKQYEGLLDGILSLYARHPEPMAAVVYRWDFERESVAEVVLDGSARLYIDELDAVGLRRQKRRRKFLAITQTLSVNDGDKWIQVRPSRFLRMTCDIAFNHPCISSQSLTLKVTAETFRRDLASARTFGFLEEVEYLKANGLARGGSLENAVVIGDDRILNHRVRANHVNRFPALFDGKL